ncbi:MAG: hypothetical protein M1826_002320 [Phylliscum demangeonii]|nr:MAG: hypothetical protein M1826_002320 [Phylliscum demangeonii]
MTDRLKEEIIEFVREIPDDKINHLYTPGIRPGLLFAGKPLRLDWQKMSERLKKQTVEFLDEIPDDKINHVYTPGITPGLLFEGTLLRLDWQKFTSGKGDQKKYNVHVQTNKHRKKNANEKRCHKSQSVAVALHSCVKMSDHLKKQMIEFLD